MLKNYIVHENYCNPVEFSIIKQNFLNDRDLSITDKAAATIKTANVDIAPWMKCKRYMHPMIGVIFATNTREFGLDLYQFTDYDTVNFNKYSSTNNGEYAWHKDSSDVSALYDLKLTAVLNISSEPYEGGEFEMFLEEPTRIPEIDIPGNLLIFPSWLYHRVKPVTKGTRETISFWISGPKIR